MGSGTTGAACIKTGRRFIGIEQSPKWFNVSKERMQADYDVYWKGGEYIPRKTHSQTVLGGIE